MKTLGEELERDALARKWLVPGMLATGRVLLLTSEDVNVLRQFAADLSLAVARGVSLGSLQVTAEAPVAIVSMREGRGLPAVFRERGITLSDQVYLQRDLPWQSRDFVGKLVVVDSLPEMVDEASGQSAVMAISRACVHASSHDRAIVVLHHLRKDGNRGVPDSMVFDGYANVSRPMKVKPGYPLGPPAYHLHIVHRDAPMSRMRIEVPKVEFPQTDERAPEKGPYR